MQSKQKRNTRNTNGLRAILSFILCAFAIIAVLSGCSKSAEQKQAERKAEEARQRATEQSAFKIAVTPTLDCLPLFLMADSGLCDTSKIDLRLKQFDAHDDIDTAIVGSSVQAAATELVRAIDLSRSHHLRLRPVAVTPLQWTLVGSKANKILKLSDLGNHMIAMTRYSATDWLTSLTKKRAKTDFIIFSAQINSVKTRLKMMEDSAMDAAWLPEPQATQALNRGNVVLVKSDKEDRHFGVIVYVEPGDETADKREAELREFTNAYNRAVDLINKNGLMHYAALIQKYTGADNKTIAKLPAIKYTHAEGPSRADMLAAEKIRFQKHTPKVKIQ